jgi:hypothetical protein
MKKPVAIAFIAVFLTLCALPALLLPFFKNDASLEKRGPAQFPSYVTEEGLNVQFSEQFEAWLNGALPLRAKILTASDALRGGLMRGQTSNVIVGKEGWLFFVSEGEDYIGRTLLTEEEVRAAAITLGLMRESVEAAGGTFVFAPVPNKSTVYAEYMPARDRKAEESTYDRLLAALNETGTGVCDLRAALTENKAQGLYHRRDSHWNYRGALIGANEILTSLGTEHDDHAGASFSMEKIWRGDLEKLLYPAGNGLDTQIVYDIEHDDFTFTFPKDVADPAAQLENYMSDREDRDDLFTTRNLANANGAVLYMQRDSFGRALLPYMIDAYETATFKRGDTPNLLTVPAGADYVYEIAERNLPRLIASAPLMYAPQREAPARTFTDGGEAECVTEPTGYGARVYGALPADAAAPDGRVYLLLGKDGEKHCFEAFPIYEQKLLGGSGERGFSACISAQSGLSGEYTLTVAAGEKTYRCGAVSF